MKIPTFLLLAFALSLVTSLGQDSNAAARPLDALLAGETAWQMNSTTLGAARKFKDGQGNYIWSQGLTPGTPETILGYPVEVNDDMQDLGANAFPVAFGNWKRGYVIVDRLGTTMLRDPYTKKGWVNFYFTKRVGGAPTNTNAIKLMKCAVS